MQSETRGTSAQSILISLLLGVGVMATGWVSRLLLSSQDERGFHVIARWPISGGGEGFIVAIGRDPSDEELRALGKRLEEEFGRLGEAVVMVFDDAAAARLVRQGSRIVGEKKFQKALLHQRAMYLKSSAGDEHSVTIYDTYPRPREVIRYESAHFREPTRRTTVGGKLY